MENKNVIHDDEFRILGTGSSTTPGSPGGDGSGRKRGSWIALSIVAMLGLAMIVFWPEPQPQDEGVGVFESLAEAEEVLFLDTLSKETPCVVKVDTLVSDRLLTLYIPHRAKPRLSVGNLDPKDRKAVMCFQAADIRADNKEILGDFVLAGSQLATGTSKRGYCAIVDGNMTIGVSANTPLLVESISGKGYFFRQYPLVDNGEPVTNKPQNKTVRKALCTWSGLSFVAVSADKLTLDEFSLTLAGLGVENAIYLVGSSFAYGWSVDQDGLRSEFGSEDLRPDYRNQSYILWE